MCGVKRDFDRHTFERYTQTFVWLTFGLVWLKNFHTLHALLWRSYFCFYVLMCTEQRSQDILKRKNRNRLNAEHDMKAQLFKIIYLTSASFGQQTDSPVSFSLECFAMMFWCQNCSASLRNLRIADYVNSLDPGLHFVCCWLWNEMKTSDTFHADCVQHTEAEAYILTFCCFYCYLR